MRRSSIALAGLLSLAAISAQAATLDYDFRSGSSTASTNSGSGLNNVRTFTVDGISVTVTAWSLTGGGNSFERAQLGRFDAGLGACNDDEYSRCSSPGHQVDNVGADDFVLFQFSELVDPTSITIDPTGNYDRDVSYWVGTLGGLLDLDNYDLGDLTGLGFGSREDSNGSSSSSPRSVSITGGLVDSILFGAAAVGSDDDDYFKIRGMSVEYTPLPPPPPPPPPTNVPEPAGLALLGMALAGLGIVRRRRKA